MQGTPMTSDQLRELSIAHADLANSLDTFELLTGTTLTLSIHHQPRFDPTEMMAAINAAKTAGQDDRPQQDAIGEMAATGVARALSAYETAIKNTPASRITPVHEVNDTPLSLIDQHLNDLPRAGWTIYQDHALLDQFIEGHSTAELAEIMGKDGAMIAPRISLLIGRDASKAKTSKFDMADVRDALARMVRGAAAAEEAF